MTKHVVKVLLLIGVLSFATICSAHEYGRFKQETITQHKVINYYSNEQVDMTNAATDLVNKYWANSVGAEAIYNLLSENYKNKLKQTKEIDNAMDYMKSVYPPQFDRNSQTYIKAWIEDSSIIKVAVVAEWFHEGDVGVAVFTFVILKEKSNWKIENIKRWEEQVWVIRRF